MKNAWDVTPIPKDGDAVRVEIAAAKGETTSAWEDFEVELADIYAAFTKLPSRSREAYALYSEQLNFKGRLDELEKLAASYFAINCDQDLEGRFLDIACYARNFSARRNEIVHSSIRPIGIPGSGGLGRSALGTTPLGGLRPALFLVPPIYQDKKYDRRNAPSFMYGSKEILYYQQCFNFLTHLALVLNALLRRLGTPPWP